MLARKTADYLPRRINQYVKGMKYSQAAESGIMQVNFGPVVIATAAFIVASVTLTSGATKSFTLANDDLVNAGSLAPFGRNVTITSNGANTRDVTVKGLDYLGQPMSETIVFNGAATVQGVKAFGFIDSVDVDSEANAPAVTIGFGDVLGLPYTANKVLTEEGDGVAKSLGTFVAGSRTTQTLTTADPRGTYNPTATLDGAAVITATMVIDNYVTSAGVGGLHGVPHFYA